MARVGRNLQFLPFYIGTRGASLKWFVNCKGDLDFFKGEMELFLGREKGAEGLTEW